MHLLVGFPNLWPAGFRESMEGVFSFSFLLKFQSENANFGRSLVQLILAALSLYPFGVKEGQKQRLLSYVPFGRFCLAAYPSADCVAFGAS